MNYKNKQRFTKKSQGDGLKTSQSLIRLAKLGVVIEDKSGNFLSPLDLPKETKFTLPVEGRDCIWEVNREAESACTFGFPYRRPGVGAPTYRAVSLQGKVL